MCLTKEHKKIIKSKTRLKGGFFYVFYLQKRCGIIDIITGMYYITGNVEDEEK